jgi:dihydrofolate reductase
MDEFERYNAMPKYVVSSTLADSDLDPEWGQTTILRSLDDVAALKEDDGGPILVQGSATLAQGLAAAGLVDRYHLLEFPVVLGSGRRLFVTEGGAKQRLRLAEHATYGNGVQLAVYDVLR